VLSLTINNAGAAFLYQRAYFSFWHEAKDHRCLSRFQPRFLYYKSSSKEACLQVFDVILTCSLAGVSPFFLIISVQEQGDNPMLFLNFLTDFDNFEDRN